MKLDKNAFTIETLLSMMAKVQQMRKAAHDESFQAGADPRFSAVVIKAEDMLKRLKKLVPVVMLAEVEGLAQLTRDLYQLFGEAEKSEIAERDSTSGH